MNRSTASGPRWLHYGAGAWAILFAAPHTWWALGSPAGFPGGPANHVLMMTTWRYYFDVVVIVLCGIALLVALAPIQAWGARIPRRLLGALAWTACAMLGLRGVAGLIADGTSDPVWWPTFMAGGILFGGVGWSTRRRAGPGGGERGSW